MGYSNCYVHISGTDNQDNKQIDPILKLWLASLATC